MKRLPKRGSGIDAALVALVYELLDAHRDTTELATGLGDVAWRLHLDYLQALQRKGRELLASASAGPAGLERR